MHAVCTKIIRTGCLKTHHCSSQLAETSGLSYALRILSVFDNDFQRQWRARDIKIMIDNPEKGQANNQMSCGGYVASVIYLTCNLFRNVMFNYV